MSIKVYLATALRDLEQCRSKERALDGLQEELTKNATSRKGLLQLKRDYSTLFDRRISAIEHLNYVRHNCTGDMKTYCESTMKIEMDNAERLRDKEANILLPVELIGDVSKEGYTKKKILFQHNGMMKPLLKDKPLQQRLEVEGGSYLVTVKNHDEYSVAAPAVTVVIGGCSPQKTMQRVLPNLCGWARFMGTVKQSSIVVEVRTDALLRASHVSVEVYELVENGANDWEDLPVVSTADLRSVRGHDDDLRTLPPRSSKLADYEDIAIPGTTPIATVNTALPFDQRVDAVTAIVVRWPVNDVTACPLNHGEQRLMQAIMNMPIPTPLPEE